LRRNQAAKLGQVSAQFSLFVIGELDFLKKPATKGVHSGEKNILRERCAFVRPIIEFHVTIAQGESVGQRGVRLLYSV
jgi:hypothetical protein